MTRLGLFLLAVAMVGMVGCGGGGGTSESSEFDPTGSVWQFLVATADAGDTMYTLSFFDSNGAKAVSGVFTAVSASGTSYSGTWTSEGYVVTGASSSALVFTLNVNDDTTTGTIDYVTPEGSGTSAATKVDATASGCSQYAGNWKGTSSGSLVCDGITTPLSSEHSEWTGTVGTDCSIALCGPNNCYYGTAVGNILTLVGPGPCGDQETVEGTFNSSTTVSGTWKTGGGSSGVWSGTKQ